MARGFLAALYAEYVQGIPESVDKFYDSIDASDAQQDALDPFEDRISDAADKAATITALAARWGITPTEDAQPSSIQPSQARGGGESDAIPPFVEWRRYLSEFGNSAAPAAASSAVPLGVHPAPVGGAVQEPSGRKKALLIGIGYSNTPAELSNSHNDVATMRAMMLRLGFAEESILCLADNQSDAALQPTRGNILTAMRWLTHGVAAGDVLFFHFSGHGAHQPDPDGGFDDALCPVDVQQEGLITSNQIFELLVRPLPPSSRLTALIDCCIPFVCLDLPWVCDPERGWVEESNPYHTLGDVICFSGQPDEEISNEGLQALRGRPAGIVTEAFIHALQEIAKRRSGPANYMELGAQMYDKFQESGHARQLRLSVSQPFDLAARNFRFFDASPNSNAEVGIQSKRKPRWN